MFMLRTIRHIRGMARMYALPKAVVGEPRYGVGKDGLNLSRRAKQGHCRPNLERFDPQFTIHPAVVFVPSLLPLQLRDELVHRRCDRGISGAVQRRLLVSDDKRTAVMGGAAEDGVYG